MLGFKYVLNASNPSMMTIEKAQPSDHRELTTIQRASKAHWGYSKKLLESWADELLMTESYIAHEDHFVFKLVLDGKIIGFYSYYFFEPFLGYLDNLFLHPDYIGKGYGRMMFDRAMKEMKEQGACTILLISDPNAERFYSKNGFIIIGRKPSAISGRYLPIMSCDVG